MSEAREIHPFYTVGPSTRDVAGDFSAYIIPADAPDESQVPKGLPARESAESSSSTPVTKTEKTAQRSAAKATSHQQRSVPPIPVTPNVHSLDDLI